MLKSVARKTFRKKREEVEYQNQVKWDDLLLIQFQSIDLPYVDVVLSYYPIEENTEINSFLFTDYLRFKNPNLHICYPKMHDQNISMYAVVCKADSVFVNNCYNIPEPVGAEIADPKDIDIVLVPLLAYDKKGVRVGYGKGYYDRYLAECREDCLKIGFSYFDPVDSIDDADEFDVPLNFCITPHRIYVF